MEEFQSLNQFRTDGRKCDESREINFHCGLNAFRNFNGSSRIIQGVSEVICFIDGPKEVFQKERKQKSKLNYRNKLLNNTIFNSKKIIIQFYFKVRQKENGNIFLKMLENVLKVYQLVIIMIIQQYQQILQQYKIMDVLQKAIQSTIINAISLAFFDAGISVRDAIISCSAGFLHQFQKQVVIGLLNRLKLLRRKQFKRITCYGLFAISLKSDLY